MKKNLLTIAAMAFATCAFAQDTTSRKLPEGSIINVELLQKISTKTNHAGDIIEFQTSEPFIIGDRVLLAKGLKVSGHLTECTKARGMGKPGALKLSMDYLTLADGRNIKLTSEIANEGKTTTGAAVAEAVVLTPFFLLKKGKDVVYETGQTFKAYVAKDSSI